MHDTETEFTEKGKRMTAAIASLGVPIGPGLNLILYNFSTPRLIACQSAYREVKGQSPDPNVPPRGFMSVMDKSRGADL